MILIGIFEKEAFNDYEVKMEKAKAAEKKLADLWTESVEATADLKRLDDKIQQAKVDRKSTRLNSSHSAKSRMPSSA